MKVDATVWEMHEGIITEYKIDNVIWVKKTVGNIKDNYFTKWLIKNVNVGESFDLEDFYKNHPRHKTDIHYKKRMSKIIHDYIELNVLQQLGNSSFKLIKEVKTKYE